MFIAKCGWLPDNERSMPVRHPALLIVLAACTSWAGSAQTEEITLERCDMLPVVRVQIEGREFRFLVDSAATSMLNIRTFAGGGMKAIEISSWKGRVLTSAREVHIPELCIGSRKLQNLTLPAIDLSPISEACGGSIDGILGVDLLENLGARLDLGRSGQLVLQPGEDPLLSELARRQENCVEAFNRADIPAIRSCFDSQVVLYSDGREIRGREEMIRYLHQRYFGSGVRMKIDLREQHLIGGAFWFGYELVFTYPDRTVTMQGMAVCRKSEGTWRLLNMHNSCEFER